MIIRQSRRILLTRPQLKDFDCYRKAVRESRDFHSPWLPLSDSRAAFEEYIDRCQSESFRGVFIKTSEGSNFVGAINISQIFMKAFCSAYLGYWIRVSFARQGLMTEALKNALDYAFYDLGLHRLEANIQTGNEASIALVRSLKFRQEGFSPRYLKIDEQWRDHERWAITVEDFEQH